MLQVEYTNQFKKDLKLAKHRGKKLELLYEIMKQIENEKNLPSKLYDHHLTGNWKSHKELHIQNDWLLIYKIIPSENIVIFTRTGSHSDLFF